MFGVIFREQSSRIKEAIIRGAIFLVSNFLEGSFPESNHPGAIVREAIIRVTIFLGGNCPDSNFFSPDTKKIIRFDF